MTDIELVTSLEKSRELKDAGFPQKKSYWAWRNVYDAGGWRLTRRLPEPECRHCDVAAPTLAEILAELPTMVQHDSDHFYLSYRQDYLTKKWIWGYYNDDNDSLWINDKEVFAKNPPDLWLRLRKEGMR